MTRRQQLPGPCSPDDPRHEPRAPGWGDRPSSPDVTRTEAFEREEFAHRPLVYTLINAATALLLALFVAAGYPAWRVSVFAGAFLLAVVTHAVAYFGRGVLRARRGGRWDWLSIAWYASLAVQVAVTGGIRSPIFLRMMVALALALVFRGFAPQRDGPQFTVLCAATAAVALAPASWVGPTVAGPYFWIMLCVIAATGMGTAMIEFLLMRRLTDVFFAETLRAREELIVSAAHRTRELEALAGRMSHDLKNPLSAIKTLARASCRTVSDPEVRFHLQVIESEADRMVSALRGYLSFSRPLEEFSPTRVSLASLVDETLALLWGRAADAQVVIRRTGDAVAEADARRVKDALVNLLLNSLEASSPGGEITVEIEGDGDGARIVVQDTGRGMPPEVLARLGTPYFTTREAGTGLGVTLARAVFEQHGGSLHFSSAPGRGTTATATLPLPGRKEE